MYSHKFHEHSTLPTNPISLPWSACFSTLHTDNFAYLFSLNFLYFPIFLSQLMTLLIVIWENTKKKRERESGSPLSTYIYFLLLSKWHLLLTPGTAISRCQPTWFPGVRVTKKETIHTGTGWNNILLSERIDRARSASIKSVGPPWRAHLTP